jgi:hypothetical protein
LGRRAEPPQLADLLCENENVLKSEQDALADQAIVARTASWVEKVVIGLGLCPFAKAVQAKGQVRYVLSSAATTAALLSDLKRELLALAAADPALVDTTLLIHPRVLADFLDYNDFLGEADDLLCDLQLEGVLQLASFHPDYCFADSPPTDPANHTNRSPYPLLHLLREASVTRALETLAEPSAIYERNIETLRAMDPASLAQLLRDD